MAREKHRHVNHVGLVPTDQLGTGATGGGTKFLADDQTYQVPSLASAAAVDVTYDNTTSGLLSTDVQGAIDEVAAGTGGGGTTDDLFGDGQDGDCTINSGTFSLSVGGSALITNNQLQRDAYFHDLTLNGGDLETRGFRVFISGTLTLTSGVVKNNPIAGGPNGGNGTGAAGGTGGGSPGGVTAAGNLAGGVAGLAGGAGGFNTAGSSPGTNAGIIVGRTAMPNGAAGGASGQGQAGGQRNTTATTNTLSDRSAWTDRDRGTAFRNMSSTLAPTLSNFVGQAVAGGGGGGAASSGGGGGGASGNSGGAIVLVAHTITGTTNIEAKGSAGGTGGNGGGTNAGGGAGGGGGPGGWIVLVYHDKSGWSGSLDVAGGAGGTGGTGIGTGSVGANGSAGLSGITKEWPV